MRPVERADIEGGSIFLVHLEVEDDAGIRAANIDALPHVMGVD